MCHTVQSTSGPWWITYIHTYIHGINLQTRSSLTHIPPRYAFPPLLQQIIQSDLHMTQTQVANSNIISLAATLLVRLAAGPCCDRWGPRITFAATLLLGAVPTFLAGAATGAAGLYAVRFFVGVLGGAFVPCQVWTTAFFDRNVVGSANALTAGLGNTGGGITYFIMPHVYAALVGDGLAPHVAWRVSFVVPGVVIVATALAMLAVCPDTPTGKWSERHKVAEEALRLCAGHGLVESTGQGAGNMAVDKPLSAEQPLDTDIIESVGTGNGKAEEATRTQGKTEQHFTASETQLGEQGLFESAKEEVVQTPTLKEALRVVATPQTLVLGACYFCSFGAELAINSILGSYYAANFPQLSSTTRGNYAAMFGLLNGAFRPLGGLLSDAAYRATGGSRWAKKALVHAHGVLMGVALVLVGVLDPRGTRQAEMFGLVALAAFFVQSGNGLNFALVPHVRPYANGIVSGFTGAGGNLGGVVFAVVFRYNGTDYARSFWIIGVIGVAVNVALCWVRPTPRGQAGGL